MPKKRTKASVITIFNPKGRSDNRNIFFRSLSLDQSVVIGPTDGRANLAQAEDIFSYIDPDFTRWGLDVQGELRLETQVEVLELVKDGRFDQFFPSLNPNLDQLCLTQDQIKKFCIDHKGWLRTDSHATFFLFKVNNEFFVADVHMNDNSQLRVYVGRFLDGYFWSAKNLLRVVVPQTT